MSFSQTLIGGAGVFGVAMMAFNAVLPGPENIVVHSLEFDGLNVKQDRTVTAEGSHFWASWSASVIGPDGKALDWCVGSGSWPYETGRKSFDIPLAQWVGSESCTPESLPRNVILTPVAVWNWGDQNTTYHGKPFEVSE